MANISFTGLGSGLDTGNIIRQLMAIERQPISRLESRVSGLEKVKSLWKQMNTKMSSLNTALNEIKTAATMTKLKATSSDETLMTATASSSAASGTYSVKVDQLANAHSASYSLAPKDGIINITVDGKSISVTSSASDTVQSLSDKINQAVSAKKTTDSTYVGVKASVIDGKMVIESEKTGTKYAYSMTQTDSSGLIAQTTLSKQTETLAKDSIVNLNGVSVTRSSNTVTDAITGVTLNLLKADTAKTFSLTVENDTKAATEAVKKFVSAYNDLVNFIDAETDVTQSDKTAGTLKGNFLARQVMSNLRSQLTSEINSSSTLQNISQIGLKTDQEGVLSLDETKLAEALKTNAADVQGLFFSANTTSKGFGDIMTSYIDGYIETGTGILDGRDKSLTEQIKTLNDSIDSKERASFLMSIQKPISLRRSSHF